jgi:PTS system ascorbate-specific IIA component
MLKDFLDKNSVRARISANTWEEVVDEAGCLLFHNKRITKDYIQAMKDTIVEMGPYVVITPGFALLHARPDKGVIDIGMSLVTLQTPVAFGHEENDPVDVAIAFSSSSSKKHLELIQEIVELLRDEEKMAAVRAAENDDALLKAL